MPSAGSCGKNWTPAMATEEEPTRNALGPLCQAVTEKGDLCWRNAVGVRERAGEPMICCGLHLRASFPDKRYGVGIDLWAIPASWLPMIAEIYEREAQTCLKHLDRYDEERFLAVERASRARTVFEARTPPHGGEDGS